MYLEECQKKGQSKNLTALNRQDQETVHNEPSGASGDFCQRYPMTGKQSILEHLLAEEEKELPRHHYINLSDKLLLNTVASFNGFRIWLLDETFTHVSAS